MVSMVDEELLTVKEVAARLKIHPETVRNWLRAGQLRGMRKSDSMGWRIPESEVRRFLAETFGTSSAADGEPR